MYFPKRNQPAELPIQKDLETPQGATLSESEIIEQCQNGRVKRSDMTISEKEKYGKYLRSYGE